jgi:small GTP-binding protein
MQNFFQISKKIVLLGDPAVGKTSMIRKFVYNEFSDKYISTLGTKISKKTMTYENFMNKMDVELNLIIWDVMGQNEYKIFHESACEGSQGALIVCDITRDDTIMNWSFWESSLFKVTGQIPIILIGNKNDLFNKHEYELQILKELSTEFKHPLYLTSARTGENVEQVFNTLGEIILKEELVT